MNEPLRWGICAIQFNDANGKLYKSQPCQVQAACVY